MASSEGDYSIPPDAVFSWSASPPAHDSSEPEHKLLKTSKHQSTPSVPRSGPAPLDQRNVVPEPECQEPEALKCGYLTKLSGRVRAWRKRWFVLRNGSLYYYKTAVRTFLCEPLFTKARVAFYHPYAKNVIIHSLFFCTRHALYRRSGEWFTTFPTFTQLQQNISNQFSCACYVWISNIHRILCFEWKN